VPADPGLRDVQLALAREFGFRGWTALRQALDDLALQRRSYAERVDLILRSATWQGDRITAARILARWPEISAANLYTAVSTGNLAEGQRRFAADPTAATRRGGPLDREPLLYLAYARLPGGESHGLEIARALLDYGADPNARWSDRWLNPFTVLTGVIGKEGEGDQPPHPQATKLAALLIDRGADPYDTQALYNTSITDDDTDWLDFLWAQSERHGRHQAWRTVPKTALIGGGVPLSALDYLLGNAASANHLQRAQWLLVVGADPNSLHAYSKRPQREEALIQGYEEMAALLGAPRRRGDAPCRSGRLSGGLHEARSRHGPCAGQATSGGARRGGAHARSGTPRPLGHRRDAPGAGHGRGRRGPDAAARVARRRHRRFP
jgi:uncharacterized protein